MNRAIATFNKHLDEAVRNRFNATSNAQPNQPNHNHHHHSHHDKKEVDRGIRRSTTSALHIIQSKTGPAHKVLPCIFCNSTEHRSGKCPKSIKQRTESYTLHGRCLRCLKKGHLAKKCCVVCKNCWDPYHVFLCPKMS